MRANVQYDDFLGTAAADISDHTDLQKFIKSRGVDVNRFEAVGAGFYGGYETSFSGFIICKDLQKSTDGKPHLIKLYFEDELDRDEFFGLFKRFEVIITPKHGGFEKFELAGEDVCPDTSNDE